MLVSRGRARRHDGVRLHHEHWVVEVGGQDLTMRSLELCDFGNLRVIWIKLHRDISQVVLAGDIFQVVIAPTVVEV